MDPKENIIKIKETYGGWVDCFSVTLLKALCTTYIFSNTPYETLYRWKPLVCPKLWKDVLGTLNNYAVLQSLQALTGFESITTEHPNCPQGGA